MNQEQFFEASKNGNIEALKKQINKGFFLKIFSSIDINAKDKNDGITPLYVASQNGHSEVVKLLLAAKADVNAARTTDGATPLCAASYYGHSEVVKLLLAAKADVNAARTTDGITPLYMASQNGHSEVVKLLLAAKADVNGARTTDRATPLYMASQNGHSEVVKLLLAAKADVNAADTTDGSTPLYIASENGHSEVVKLLLAAKADVNGARTTDRATPLYMASQNGHSEVVKLLLAAKADVNAADTTDGSTPLYIASQNGHSEVVKLLLVAKADVNAARTTDGATPLCAAANCGYTENVTLLMRNAADVDVKMKGGDTALSLARQGSHIEIIRMLEGGLRVSDESPSQKTEDGSTTFSEKIFNFLTENTLSIGTLDEFRKGQKDFDNWGSGVITGSKEWIVNKLSTKLLTIRVVDLNSISCPKDYSWQSSKLEGFTVRIEVSIPSGMLAGYYIGRIGDDLFGLFGYGFNREETEQTPKLVDDTKEVGGEWLEVFNALQMLSSETEPSTEMSYALCDANGIIEKCKESSLNPKTIKLHEYTDIDYNYRDDKQYFRQALSVEDTGPDTKDSIGAICYGQDKYIWYTTTPYSEKKLRDFLQALPVSITLSIPTHFWKDRLEKVKSGTLNDILDWCKSVTKKSSGEGIFFSSAGYVHFSSSVDAGEYEQVYTYEIRKKSQDTFEWVNNLGTRTK